MLISVDQAVEILLRGSVVAVPTETVYGLAAIATNPEAIAKVFGIKNRPADNPLICHFHSVEQITAWVTSIPENTKKLLHRFSPGPVSFMLEIPESSPLKFATCGSHQVIVRIPDHPLFLSILQKLDAPVAAPSANTSGRVSPTSAEMVMNDIGEKIEGIVDGGSSLVGLESTILDARSNNQIIILREGAIGEKEISTILPEVEIMINKSENGEVVPGAKYRHYAPKTPIAIIKTTDEILDHPGSVIILTLDAMQTIPRSTLHNYTVNGIHLISLGSLDDLNIMAKNFYQVLSSVDQLEVQKAFFLATDFGSSSLGRALQNRLERIIAL